ncbi:MAG: hypothetical protein JWP81_4454 [Ferruginibacter sp.]|nr:hypothetical protein [Ferruginibacter sp.]
MKSINYFLYIFLAGLLFVSCEKKDVPQGLPEFENHYYAAYIPNTNTAVIVQKTQTALVKFPVQFYSAFSRSYDAVAYYSIVTTGITTPAIVGKDFDVVDKNGKVLTAGDSARYTINFPKAERFMDTIYLKMLNNPLTGTRKMEVQIQEHKTDQYYVDIFSTAFRRPVEIR